MANESEDPLSWNEYFMLSAMLASKRSKDPCTKVGAVVVNNDNRIVGSGYNGFPNGISDSDLPWTKDSNEFENTKYAYVVHAEANCLLNSIKHDLSDCTMFVTMFPCSSCTKLIIQKGIKSVMYANNPKNIGSDYTASIRMLKLAGVDIKQYKEKSEITLKL